MPLHVQLNSEGVKQNVDLFKNKNRTVFCFCSHTLPSDTAVTISLLLHLRHVIMSSQA